LVRGSFVAAVAILQLGPERIELSEYLVDDRATLSDIASIGEPVS
jgi:hypothetical protein